MQAVIVTDAQRRGARVTNENDQMDISEATLSSECCNALIIPDGLHTYCGYCGEFCKTQ